MGITHPLFLFFLFNRGRAACNKYIEKQQKKYYNKMKYCFCSGDNVAIKEWIIENPDREKAKIIAEECNIDPFTALIACGRGITDSSELEQFIAPEPILCDPEELIDIRLAADVINTAVKDGTLIAVYGDYDCDGVVSTAILYDYLTSRGANVTAYIPDRMTEGYGMNKNAVDTLKDMGVGLIVTVDNGISSAEEIAYAKTLGIDTVVTDHHIVPDVLPEAAAAVDPHRRDCPSDFKEVCGAQVAFKLCCVLDDKAPEQMLPRYADILAVAIIGDVMPLLNENRCIIREGIKKIRQNPCAGIAAILSCAGIDRKTVSSNRLSFAVVPRINAAGRMGSAKRALDLLLCGDMLQALKIADEIDNDNSLRQQTEREIFECAQAVIEEKGYAYDRVIVVSGKDWHCGVIGIVASRICEKYGKPAIVMSVQGNEAHGSGRSFDGFNLYDAVYAVRDTLTRYGGHALAAGVSTHADGIEAFRKAINDYAVSFALPVQKLHIDCRLNPSAMSVDMVHALKGLEPFGFGNPVPIFALIKVKLEKITELSGGKHLKLLFSKDGCAFQALLFGVTRAQFFFCIGDLLDLAVTLDTNFYRDEYTLSVLIKAIRMSDTDYGDVFRGRALIDDYFSGRNSEPDTLFPTREQVGSVYRLIAGHAVRTERLKYFYDKQVGYAKTQIAVTVLSELGLIAENDGILSACDVHGKSDLMNSETYKKLCKEVQ